MVWQRLFTLGLICCIHALTSTSAAAQGGGGGSFGTGGELNANEYELKLADGRIQTGSYKSWHRYYLAPGWAKPRRFVAAPGGFALASRTGQPTQVISNSLPPGLLTGMMIDAILLEKMEDEPHPRIIVGHATRVMGGMGEGGPGGYADMGMGMGSGGMGGAMGGGMSMSGMGGGMDGGMGGGMGMGMPGGMSGMAGMSNSELTNLRGKITIVPLEESQSAMSSTPASESIKPFSKAQLKNLADLVQLDCWIDAQLTTLRTVRKDAEKFKETEAVLKGLLSQEYELQLSKQRDDIERLSEKLKMLQSELERRMSAQERVIDVQLGQLILEAQGLIGERP